MVDESLKALLQLKRSGTRIQILDLLITSDKPMSASELATALNVSENAINVALHHLTNAKLVQRVERGIYDINTKTFCKALMAIILSTNFPRMVREYDKTMKSLKVQEENVED